MSTSIYQNSIQHKENARLAGMKAIERIHECQCCHKKFGSSGILRHSKACHPCPVCSNPTISKFCSRRCAASFNHTGLKRSSETRKRISVALKGKSSPLKGKPSIHQGRSTNNGNVKNVRACRVQFPICTSCNQIFVVRNWRTTHRKTCSKQCAMNALMKRYGTRIGKKRMHPYWCATENRFVSLESNWEVEIAMILDINRISWTRPLSISWNDGIKDRHYFADFYLPKYDLYLDPKNQWCMEKYEKKMTAVSQQVNIIYGHIDLILTQIALLRGSIYIPG